MKKKINMKTEKIIAINKNHIYDIYKEQAKEV